MKGRKRKGRERKKRRERKVSKRAEKKERKKKKKRDLVFLFPNQFEKFLKMTFVVLVVIPTSDFSKRKERV